MSRQNCGNAVVLILVMLGGIILTSRFEQATCKKHEELLLAVQNNCTTGSFGPYNYWWKCKIDGFVAGSQAGVFKTGDRVEIEAGVYVK